MLETDFVVWLDLRVGQGVNSVFTDVFTENNYSCNYMQVFYNISTMYIHVPIQKLHYIK